jgi:hypothetical protein
MNQLEEFYKNRKTKTEIDAANKHIMVTRMLDEVFYCNFTQDKKYRWRIIRHYMIKDLKAIFTRRK